MQMHSPDLFGWLPFPRSELENLRDKYAMSLLLDMIDPEMEKLVPTFDSIEKRLFEKELQALNRFLKISPDGPIEIQLIYF